MSETISVLYVDDDQMVREGIGLLIQKIEYVKVVGECSNGEEALRCVKKLHPDVVVTDVYMPILGGIQLASRLHQENPEIGVVILTAAQDKDLALAAMNAGAFGYLLKDSDPAEIGIAIRAAANRKIYVTPRINDELLSDRVRATNPARSLTARHREVLYLIAAGKSNKEAAAVLGIATKTVDKHRTEIMQRLGVHNSAELVRCAMDSGIL